MVHRELGPFHPRGSLAQQLDLAAIQRCNYICNSTVVLHRGLVDRTGPFRAVKFEDWEYWQRVLATTDCLDLDQDLTSYTTDRPRFYSYNW